MKDNFFKGKRVTVMGLGLVGGGEGVVKFLVKKGAKVLVTDLKTKKDLKSSLKKIKGLPVKLVLGRHQAQDFIDTDLIIKNPGVADDSPFLKIAKKNKIAIETDIGIFFQLCEAQIIGITGTKGKSTVATLLYHLIKSKYPKAILAGNIGTSPLQSLEKINKKSKVILELSSWQLEGLKKHKKSPKIAVITNIYPDHLNRHKDLRDYINSKKIIFCFQKKSDVLLLNYDNPIVRRFSKSAESRIRFFSQKKPLKKIPLACFLRNKRIFFGKEKNPICSLKDLKLGGSHNVSNTLAAVSIAKICQVPLKNIRNVLKGFEGVPFRQEFIKEVKGVKYFNDTTSTIPQASIAAILTLKKRFSKNKMILIAGGMDKNLNYEGLAKEIKKNVNHLLLFPGTASKKIKKELLSLNFSKKRLFSVRSMKEAVMRAKNMAQAGDVVVLSPGATSFNMFKNEFDRGEQFNREVKKL